MNKIRPAHDPLAALTASDAKALEEADRLYRVLNNLHYEGKAMVGKNVNEAREVLLFFRTELAEHVELEDKVLFPFLETHLPKLETLISLLRSEHEDFRRSCQDFELALMELVSERRDATQPGILERIRETGIYLVYLLRNHVHVEQEGIYKVAERDLRAEEKQELARRMAQGGGVPARGAA